MICVEKQKDYKALNSLFLTSLEEAQKVRNELERSIIKINKKFKK